MPSLYFSGAAVMFTAPTGAPVSADPPSSGLPLEASSGRSSAEDSEPLSAGVSDSSFAGGSGSLPTRKVSSAGSEAVPSEA